MADLSMRVVTMIAAGAMLGLGATAAEAQSRYEGRYQAPYQTPYQTPYADQGRYGSETRYSDERTYRSEHRSSGYSDWSVAAQRDRPGDYRCDAFWDANRSDCDARWRDQRHRTSSGSGSYGYDRGYRDHDRRQDDRYGYGRPQPYYGSAWRHPPAYGQGGATPYYGAYGRPDLVYPGSGSAYGGGRDARRVDWCHRTYRSYDPRTGYYRAYSGRLIYCG
ncbi:MAG: BA14K family protein [Brevundimonas sp.]|nr:BA14K family protein [Brevundimonas sp.]